MYLGIAPNPVFDAGLQRKQLPRSTGRSRQLGLVTRRPHRHRLRPAYTRTPGGPRSTGEIPCALASAQEIRPFPLSSYSASADPGVVTIGGGRVSPGGAMMRSPGGAAGLVIPGGTLLSTVDAGGARTRCGVGPYVRSTVTRAAVDAPARSHGRFDFQSFTRRAPFLRDHAVGAPAAGCCPAGTIRPDEGRASTSRGASGSGHRGESSCAGPGVYAQILVDEQVEHWQQRFHDVSPLRITAGGAVPAT